METFWLLRCGTARSEEMKWWDVRGLKDHSKPGVHKLEGFAPCSRLPIVAEKKSGEIGRDKAETI